MRGISQQVDHGEVLGIVGESGSGKSVDMLAALGLQIKDACVTGSVRFKGREILGLSRHDLRHLRGSRGSRIAMIFQDPLSSLNPLMIVGDQIAEAVRVHNPDLSRRAALDRAKDLMARVTIPQPDQRLNPYPHEFSGGMRQRVMIAMAVVNDPDLLIADEPTTALDMTVQAQIMEVLTDLQSRLKLGLILITHDLGPNRGKHSIALDLKSPEGRAIVMDLAARADVVVENLRAGTADRTGIDYRDIHKINPGIVDCAISGCGQTGPEAARPGYDFIMRAESGLMAITGAADDPPNRLGVAFTDVVARMVATQSVLAALYRRRETRVGQFIDVAILALTLNLLVNVRSAHLNAGMEAKRYGNAYSTVVPYQLFTASDGPFALTVGNDRMSGDSRKRVLLRLDLARDPRYATSHQRALHRPDRLYRV